MTASRTGKWRVLLPDEIEPGMEIGRLGPNATYFGRLWWHCPETGQNVFVCEGEEPDGYIRGVAPGSTGNSGQNWFYDPSTNERVMCLQGDEPDGYVPGLGKRKEVSEAARKAYSESSKRVLFHDPATLINTKHNVEDAPPHLVRGRAPGTSRRIRRINVPTTFTDPTTFESVKVYLKSGEEPPPGYERGTPRHFRDLARQAERREQRKEQGPSAAQLRGFEKLRQAMSKKRWWHHTDTEENRLFNVDEKPPDGFIPGRFRKPKPPKPPRKKPGKFSPERKASVAAALKRRREQETQEERDLRFAKRSEAQRGMVWWFNKTTGEKKRSREQLSGDWVRGQGKAHKPKQPGPTKQSATMTGRRWFYSPESGQQAQFHPGSEPDGYVRGKAPKN